MIAIDKKVKYLSIEDYLAGMSYREVGKKHGVDHKTVRRWVISSGNTSRDRLEALIVAGKRLRGTRRSPVSEFKKGQTPWNKDTKGVMKSNRTSFKKGEHTSLATEFKKGQLPWNFGVNDGPKKYNHEFNYYLKEKIRHRDNYKCCLCNKLQISLDRKLDCHHIDYNKKNCKEDNLISLCRICHMKTNSNRDYWKDYLKELLCHLKH